MPRFGLQNPHDQDPSRAQLVQSYMVLHSQQISVRRRLSVPPPPSPTASPCSSPSHSPPRYAEEPFPATPVRRHSKSSTISSPLARPQRSPFLRRPSVPSILESPDEGHIDADEMKLFDINKRIEATLTDLLNCESIKHDIRMRAWVQTRLDDAQQTLNHRRYRASIASLGAHRRSTSYSNERWSTTDAQAMDRPRVDEVMDDEGVRKLSI